MKQRINSLITELNSGLIEREPHIKEALLTMLAGENLLLVVDLPEQQKVRLQDDYHQLLQMETILSICLQSLQLQKSFLVSFQWRE